MTARPFADSWLISTEDDGAHGFRWYATRLGVLWASGWLRTRSEGHAEAQALIAGRTAWNLGGETQRDEVTS